MSRAEWFGYFYGMLFVRRICLLSAVVLTNQFAFGNGGAWQTGVPLTGNAAASDKGRSTKVAIEEESLLIDLHQEFAAVEVRYRMRNTGGSVTQDFFFPVERWTPEDDAEEHDSGGGKVADLEAYQIMADKTDLAVKTIDVKPVSTPSPTPESKATAEPTEDTTADGDPEKDGATETAETEIAPYRYEDDFAPPTKHWKKSEIPFAANQTREVTIRYRVGYSGAERSVSDDGHKTDQVMFYSLSPAATWKGAIGKGKIVVNVLHPRPEEVAIEKPNERFKKVSETRYEWSFENLKPTLEDDLKIVAHRAWDSYSTGYSESEEERQIPRDYFIQGERYFLVHGDFEAVASSTLAASGKKTYEAKNIRGMEGDAAWAEGVEGDGIGQNITLTVNRPLPLDEIQIVPGYRSLENPSLWAKNNRVAELEITLNDERTFTAKIPDEQFADPYPIPVRDYNEPVKTVKLTIKAVHRGTAARDTCISWVRLKGKLAKKPEVHPAR